MLKHLGADDNINERARSEVLSSADNVHALPWSHVNARPRRVSVEECPD